MYVNRHFFFGLLFSSFLLLIFPKIGIIGFFAILLSSVFIDFDHYIYYVYKKKDISLKRAYKWFVKVDKKLLSMPKKKRNDFYVGICLMHGVEIVIISFLSSFFSKYFLFIMTGFLFHLTLDSIEQIGRYDRLEKVFLIGDILKFKKLRHIEDVKD